MTASDEPLDELLRAAREGSDDALGAVFEACRAYLVMIAENEMDASLRPKGGASDLVQQTFLEAQRDFAGFRGETEAELLGWLRQILRHNVSNFARAYRNTAKRDVSREVALEAGPDSADWRGGLAAVAGTPSGVVRADEERRALEAAMRRLPDDYRRVLELRYRDELPFERIGELMDRSSEAVRKLWSRAVERLRLEWDGSSGPESPP